VKQHTWQTRKQFFFISVGGNLYVWLVKIGRFEMTWETK
jgi:hypothetical protein